MKNMNDKTKKRLILAGGVLISAVLLVMIGARFTKEPVTEADVPSQSTEISDVMVEDPNEIATTEKEEEVTAVPTGVTEEPKQDSGVVDTGTEQKIQEDIPEKPTYTKEQLTDPTQKPNGEKVESPKAEEKDTTPTATPKPKKTETSTEQNASGGLPGFDSVPDGGANQVTEADDMYENGNKIGDMN